MKSSSTFIPLSELDGYSDEQLSWRVPLPEYVPTESIGVNVNRLKWLSHLGGIGHLRIDTQDGDQTTYQPEITGIDTSGSATAGMKVVKQKASLSAAETSPNSTDRAIVRYSEYQWGDGHITLNATEMAATVLNKTRDSDITVRQPDVWSRVIDKGLRKGISKVTEEQLLRGVTLLSKVGLGLVSMNVLGAVGIFPDADLIPVGLLSSLYVQGIQSYLAWTDGLPISERRLSLIPGYQIDRLTVVKGLNRAQKLVRTIN